MVKFADIKGWAMTLPREERFRLLEALVESLRPENGDPRATVRRPADLRGMWKDRFPEDFDVDAALKDIREGWQRGAIE